MKDSRVHFLFAKAPSPRPDSPIILFLSQVLEERIDGHKASEAKAASAIADYKTRIADQKDSYAAQVKELKDALTTTQKELQEERSQHQMMKLRAEKQEEWDKREMNQLKEEVAEKKKLMDSMISKEIFKRDMDARTAQHQNGNTATSGTTRSRHVPCTEVGIDVFRSAHGPREGEGGRQGSIRGGEEEAGGGVEQGHVAAQEADERGSHVGRQAARDGQGCPSSRSMRAITRMTSSKAFVPFAALDLQLRAVRESSCLPGRKTDSDVTIRVPSGVAGSYRQGEVLKGLGGGPARARDAAQVDQDRR